MKIFICHSSHDKWVAKQVSKQLKELGFNTFLDEKNIATGDSIDDSIQGQLKDCYELLIIVSQSSLKSHWVFVEIGGAKALGKRIVPILLHVEPNEIPQPIAQHLARDINTIDSYYEELTRRATGKKQKPSTASKSVKKGTRTAEGFNVGDKVRILDVDRLTQDDRTETPKWVDSMNKYSGRDTKIVLIDWEDESPELQIKLDADVGKHWWAARWLTHSD